MDETFIAIMIILGTIGIYLLMITLYRHFMFPILLPVLTTTIVIIILLKSFDIPYDDYMVGGKWLDFLLGPAVVAFAYPLYHQRKLLLQYALPIFSGVIIGLITGIITVILFAAVLSIPKEMLLSLIPKSLTTPVAMQVSSELGGTPSLTVAFVMIAGFTGAILGPVILKWFHIRSLLGTGIALGSASHAIGTSKAYEYGELALSMSSVAMTLSAILGPFFGILLAMLI